MSTLDNERHRTEILHRLKRAEGQLRGIQRMVEEGQPCQAIATQMAAVRKALDSACAHMMRCQMEQALLALLTDAGDVADADNAPDAQARIQDFLKQVDAWSGPLR